MSDATISTPHYANHTTSSSQRQYFKNEQTRCPLCAGHANMPQHRDIRCIGYMTEGSIICSRVPSPNAGPLGTYRHRRRGRCDCGQEHEREPFTFQPAVRQPRPASATPKEKATNPLNDAVRTIDFKIRDAGGTVIATHRRYEFTDKPKTFRFLDPDARRFGLGGISSRDLPLYGAHDVASWPADCVVVLVEGETTRDWLRARGVYAVAVISGASNTPNAHVWECLKGHPIIQWPDADEDGQGEKLMQASARLLQAQGNNVWCLDVGVLSYIKDGFDAADWTGTDEQLRTFLRGGVYVEPLLKEADGPAAASEAGEQLSEHWKRRALVNARYASLSDDSGWTDTATRLRSCRQFWKAMLCSECKARPAFQRTCHENLCALCAAGRFFSDWRMLQSERLKGELFTTVRYIPSERITTKQARQRFTESRKKAHLQGGIVGWRWSREHGAIILLGLPAGVEAPAQLGTFTADLVREGQDEGRLSSWLWSEYEAEIEEGCAEDITPELFREWVTSVNGRRRFSGFGTLYPTYSPMGDKDDKSGTDEPKPIKLGTVSGGGGSAGSKEPLKCPFCGCTRLHKMAEQVPAHRIHHTRGHAEWFNPGDVLA